MWRLFVAKGTGKEREGGWVTLNRFTQVRVACLDLHVLGGRVVRIFHVLLVYAVRSPLDPLDVAVVVDEETCHNTGTCCALDLVKINCSLYRYFRSTRS